MNLSQKIGMGIDILRCRFLGQRIPLIVTFVVTSRCNANCKYCGFDGKDDEFSTDEALSLIDEIADCGCRKIAFTGGEPLLRDDIGKLILRAKERGMSVNLNSNGLLVPERIDAVKLADMVVMSLDGPEDVNDSMRGAGSFKGVMRAIDVCRANNVKVSLTTVLTKENLGCVEWILENAKKCGVTVDFQPVVEELSSTVGSVGRRPDNRRIMPERKELEDAIGVIREFKRKNKMIVKPSFSTLDLIPDVYYSGRMLRCGRGTIFCKIEGRMMTPCGRAHISERVPIDMGNSGMGFSDAWKKISGRPRCSGKCCTGAIEQSNIWNFSLRSIVNQLKNESY